MFFHISEHIQDGFELEAMIGPFDKKPCVLHISPFMTSGRKFKCPLTSVAPWARWLMMEYRKRHIRAYNLNSISPLLIKFLNNSSK